VKLEPGATVVADRPAVIDEVFDGEAVVVHLGTGRYYALNQAATEVWELVRDGRRPCEVAELIAARRTEEDRALAAGFVDRLAAEGLLVSSARPPSPPGSAGPPLGPWEDPPTLQSFEDLQDLLLVDPIHDVTLGPDGWPIAAGES
jgi:hypothetical protein